MLIGTYITSKTPAEYPTAFLINIQPQVSEDDDLYIIDTTPERIGLAQAKRYGASKNFIFVECGQVPPNEVLELLKNKSLLYKHDSFLYLENVIVSSGFVPAVKKIQREHNPQTITADLLKSYDILNPNFSFITKYPLKVEECKVYTPQCFSFSLKVENPKILKIVSEKEVICP